MHVLVRPICTMLVMAGLISGCVSGGGTDSGESSFIGRGWDSLAGVVGRDKEKRDDALIDAGVDAVRAPETNPYMARLQQELEKQLSGSDDAVTRAGDQLIVSLSSADLFAANSDALKRGGLGELNNISTVLKKNDRTTVDVYGHTDNGGDEKKNLELTQKRALAVARHLAGQGVDSRRLSVTGFGSQRPVKSNDTDEERIANRRIEIQISPVKKR